MRAVTLKKIAVRFFLAFPIFCGSVSAQEIAFDHSSRVGAAAPAGSSIQAQARESAKTNMTVDFDPATQLVTVRMTVQDANGSFIPDIRRDNFAVYENGVRQRSAAVDIEHAPLTLALLMEWGGRYEVLNDALAEEVPRAARQLFGDLGAQDKIAIYRYGDRIGNVADFSARHESLDGLITALKPPEFSESNFYDALNSTMGFMKPVAGRKAILLVSSGIDTFSKTTYRDVLAAARDSGTPIYAIDIGPVLRQAQQSSTMGPSARIAWRSAEEELQELARASGGRLYSPLSTFDLSSVYDDVLENLRIRYVITYKSPGGASRTARTVRVDLVDPNTGAPLRVVDATGKEIRESISAENTYTPGVQLKTEAGKSADIAGTK